MISIYEPVSLVQDASSPMGSMSDGAVQLALRWVHVVAGVLWIGVLYFFNWVNAAFAPTMDAETKKKVVPELMPRALYWFRWGAAYTWITGFLLLGLIYHHSPIYFWDAAAEPNRGLAGGMLVAAILLFVVYDQVAKALAKQPMVSLLVWWAISLGYAYWMQSAGASNRAIFIHVGAMFGTAMAANVWMRIWPAQKRIIAAVKAGTAPNPADPALAGLRSKHNTYMSVPLLLTMVSVHQTWLIGQDQPVLALAVSYAIAFPVTSWIFAKSTQVKGI